MKVSERTLELAKRISVGISFTTTFGQKMKVTLIDGDIIICNNQANFPQSFTRKYVDECRSRLFEEITTV